MRDPAYLATAIACVAALATINTAYAVRRRRRQAAQLATLEQQLARAIRAEQRRALDLQLDGEFAALGRDVVLRRFLNSHPELRPTAGQEGGTT